jgi:hypothetical protein
VAYSGGGGQVVSSGPDQQVFSAIDEMRVRFRIDKVPGIADVFQTSEGNSGIRLEVSSEGLGCLIVGDPLSSGNEKARIIVLPGRIGFGQDHRLVIGLHGGCFTCALDNEPAIGRDDLNEVRASRLVLGNGFDGHRQLTGSVYLDRLVADVGEPVLKRRLRMVLVRMGIGCAVLLHAASVLLLYRRLDSGSHLRFEGTAISASA